MSEVPPPNPSKKQADRPDRDASRKVRTHGRSESGPSAAPEEPQISIEEVKAGFGKVEEQPATAVNSESAPPFSTPIEETHLGDESQPSSRAEAKKKLRDLLAKYGPDKFSDSNTPEGKKALVAELREARAKEIADRLGITEKRQAMLDLEDAYKKEVAANHGKYFNKKESKVAMAYAEARLAWTTSLRESSSQLDGRRRLEAHAIGIRDTILREEALRQQGKVEGLSERGKSAMGTAMRWGALPVKKTFQGYKIATEKVGEGVAYAHQFLSKESLNADEKKLLAAKYTKAARIISSAGVATVLFGGFGSLNVGLSFGLRAARGALGIAAGASVGAAAGQLYKGTLGEKSRLELRKEKRGVVKSVQDLLRFENAQQKGNRVARERVQKNVELAAAFITGAGFAAGSGAAIHTITGLEAVQKAAEDLEDAAQKIATAGESVTESAQSIEGSARAVSAASATLDARVETPGAISSTSSEALPDAASPMVASVVEGPPLHEAIIEKGEGFNQLIVDLRTSGFTGFDPELSASEISQRIGALRFVDEHGVAVTPESAVMQVGDKLVVNAEGDVLFVRNGVEQILFENKDGVLVPHKLEGVQMQAVSRPSIEARPAAIPETINEVPAPTEDVATDTSVPYQDAVPMENVEPERSPVVETPETGNARVPTLDDWAERQVGAEIRVNSLHPQPDTASVPTLDDWNAEHEASTGAEFITNQHGVQIDSSRPATYEWKVPGTDRILTVAYGGSAEEQSLAARAYASVHPGSTVYFMVPERDSITGQLEYRMDAWDTVADPSGERIQDTVLNLGDSTRDFPVIGPEDLTRKLANPLVYEAR